jgi:hypothetical protein
LKEPLQSVCPLAPPPVLPTSSPTAATFRPTPTPTTSTSVQPSATPTTIPSFAPTTSCPPIRRNINNDTSVMGLEPVSDSNMLLQKQNRNQRIHSFYDPLQYDVRGRNVGTRSPVLPPSECPELNATILEKDGMALKDNNTKPILKKKTKSKLDKKDKLQLPKGGTTSKQMSKVDKYDSDDDLSFVEIEKPSTNTSNAPAVVASNESDTSFGSISSQNSPASLPEEPPTNAPTTTYERLEAQFEMSRQGWNGETSITTTVQHPSMMKEKNKKRKNRW